MPLFLNKGVFRMEIFSDTIKIDSKGTKMIAHRGASGLESENTNAAFVAAGNRSYFGIECDVHVTKDGKFPIIHDDDTSRVSDVNLSVENSTLAELKEVKLHDRQKMGKISDIQRADLVIPELKDYISICKKYKKKAVLELKNEMSENDIKNIIEEIKELDYFDNVIFISFSRENVLCVRKLEPTSHVQFLASFCDDQLVDWLIENKLDFDMYYKRLTKEVVDTLHKHNLEVNCWTVDDPDDAKELVAWGVDYITSNILE